MSRICEHHASQGRKDDKLLVDTDVLIWYLRGHDGAARRIDILDELKISAVTYMELMQGCRNKEELTLLKKDFSARKAKVLQIDASISNRASSLIETHALSDGLQLADALIAGTALEYRLAVLTANTKHFEPIIGLTVECFTP